MKGGKWNGRKTKIKRRIKIIVKEPKDLKEKEEMTYLCHWNWKNLILKILEEKRERG